MTDKQQLQTKDEHSLASELAFTSQVIERDLKELQLDPAAPQTMESKAPTKKASKFKMSRK